MSEQSMESHEAFMAFERERLSSRMYRSDSARGFNICAAEPKKRVSAAWPVLAGIVCALIVCAVFSITQQG
ncbi:MAG TPA: hypothetical protein VLZ84_07165 [Asticcacaulis sp.]|nr:hypothetical protein [Asticcacaulis sp.]